MDAEQVARQALDQVRRWRPRDLAGAALQALNVLQIERWLRAHGARP